jgi:cytochrome c2
MFDTMVFTKALGALCGALLIFLLGGWVATSLYVPGSRNLPPAFVVDTGVDVADGVDAAAAPAEDLPLGDAFLMADAAAGARVWNQCRACHVADDARNSVGPYLLGVVGRDIGAVDGFRYSGALPAGERWTIENLYAYLENPRGWAPGTSMAFNGLRSQADRVNIIAFLIDNSPDFDPAEIPAPSAVDEAALEDEAPAEDAVAEAVEEAVEEEAVAEAVEEAVEEEAVAEAVGEAVEEEAVAEAVEEAVEEEAVAEAVEEAVEEEAVAEAVEEAVEEEAVAEAVEEAVEEEAVAEAVEEAVEEEAVAEAVEEAVEEEAVAEAFEEAVEEEAVVAEEMSAFAQMVASGDAAAGARVWNQCRACHVADAPTNRVGPHLVGVIGRQSNSVEGFRYSGRLPDVIWTLDELNAYLESPRGYAPGTSMAFNGLRNEVDRANVLAYIQSLN